MEGDVFDHAGRAQFSHAADCRENSGPDRPKSRALLRVRREPERIGCPILRKGFFGFVNAALQFFFRECFYFYEQCRFTYSFLVVY